jgi:N-methylhydantoinase A
VAEYALAVPTLDINAIGAGGGSIAAVKDGVLTVGPDSAGADPGPASYGQGGERPTVTDANLVLGLLDAANFLGGRKRLDAEAAARAIARHVAGPLDLSTEQAALGIIRIINAKMADGVRAVSVSRGFDPRDACLVAAGGAGPLHACGIAEELGVGLILVPSASSVFCATGMLASHLRQDLVRHAAIRLSNRAEAVAQINRLRRLLLEQGRDILDRQGIPAARQRLEFSAAMMFEGQFNALETRLAMLDSDGGDITEAGLPALREEFEATHERIYGYVLAGEPVEIQSLRLSAIGLTEPLTFPKLSTATTTADLCLRGVRKLWSAYGRAEAAVYDGTRLQAGHEIAGPALIDHPTTTINVALGWQARVDPIGNLMMWRADTQYNAVLARLRANRT